MTLLGIPIEIFLAQGIFAILFVYLFHDTREEAKKREDKLLVQIDRQNEAQSRIVQAIERLEEKINNLKEG